jgi:tRNA1Val (adenine37-N6)-methyltransferase
MSPATTVDGVCRGVLELEQPREGYRFNLDPVILAGFAAARAASPERIVDLGAGVGIVGLLLALRFPAARVLLVELQLELAELAEANVRRNRLEARVEVRCLDLREAERWSGPGPTLLVSNPPFFPAGAGRPSTRPQVSLAKHEITCTLDGLLAALERGLSVGDELALVYPYPRETELLRGLEAHRCPALRIQRVQPLPERPAARTMVLARRGAATGPVPAEDPALVVEEEPGRYSLACQAVLEPEAWVR